MGPTAYQHPASAMPGASLQDLQARALAAPNRIPAVKGIESEREEIRQRVATFKAHQQRFIRERKDYAASEWNRMLASQR
jgi:hypothetical protein